MLNQRAAAHDLALFAYVDTTCEGDLAPFWTDKITTPVCSCPKCERVRYDAELDRLIDEGWNDYPMTREEMSVADYFAELDGWRRDEDWYRQLDQEDDEQAARLQAEADKLVIAAYLAGAAVWDPGLVP